MMDEKLVKALRHNIFNDDEDKLIQQKADQQKPLILLQSVEEIEEGSFHVDDTRRGNVQPRRKS